MTRFLVLLVFCLAAVGGVSYLLGVSVRDSGQVVREGYQPKPDDILSPVGSDAQPPDPAQNLNTKLQSLIDDRDRNVAGATLDVGRPAAEIVQLISEIESARMIFDAEWAAYQAECALYRTASPMLRAGGGPTGSQPHAPKFPYAEIQHLEARFRTASTQFEIAKNSAENKVKIIQNGFLRQFIDIVGKNRASEAPPVPVTAADEPIRQATERIAHFHDFMTLVYRGFLNYKGR